MAAPVGLRKAALLLALAPLLAGSARAELVDPTRSPIGARGNGEGATGEGRPAAAVPAPTRVQMIVRGPGETLTAVIDGNNVRVGDTVRLPTGSARVERITATSVVLARAGGRETLQLFPGIERFVHCARGPGSRRPGGC